MNDTDRMLDRDRVVAALRELVEALDRRVPQVERLGEMHIAREGAALREEALRRIQEISTARSASGAPAADGPDAVMTDNGGPLPRK